MLLEGKQFGRYRFERLLGSGGMGEVYLSTDTLINRNIAIKVIRTENSATEAGREATRLFQREMKAIAALDHPHILPLFDYGEDHLNDIELAYMVIPYRPEGSLLAWAQDRAGTPALSFQELSFLLNQAASALQHAHNRQIIHQDVKPSNFLIQASGEDPTRPHLLLSDFGVAKLMTAASNASQSIRGTPTYMAPEQWQGHPVPATDQYALAMMAYTLLTGQLPFHGNITQLMYQHSTNIPHPPSTLNTHVSSAIDTVILRALAKEPEARFATIAAFAQSFREAVQQDVDRRKMSSLPTVPSRVTPPGNIPLAREEKLDIRATLALTRNEALHGTRRTLTLPGGRHATITIPPGSYDGQVVNLAGQGEARPDGRVGSLILTLAVQLTEEIQKLADPDDLTRTVLSSNSQYIAPRPASPSSQTKTVQPSPEQTSPSPVSPTAATTVSKPAGEGVRPLDPVSYASSITASSLPTQESHTPDLTPPTALVVEPTIPAWEARTSELASPTLLLEQVNATDQEKKQTTTQISPTVPQGNMTIPAGKAHVEDDLSTTLPATRKLVLPAPASTATRTRRRRIVRIVLIVVLLLLLIAGGVGGLLFFQANQATTRAHTNATATVNGIATHTQSTRVVQQAQANASATAQTIAANPYPAYLHGFGTGTLALYDPLQDNSYHNNWDESASCSFINGAYHVTTPLHVAPYYCVANTPDFSNFVYQVQMNVIKGDLGGFVFRVNQGKNQDKFYRILVGRVGYYEIQVCKGVTLSCKDLQPSTLGASITKGLNQPNQLAIVAQGSTFSLYANGQHLTTVQDGTYFHGQIGVMASSISNPKGDNLGNPTDIAYTNAEVWVFK